MYFDYRCRDPEELASDGLTSVTIAIIACTRDRGGKSVCSITFPYRYFPVIHVLMPVIISRLDRWGKLPEGWQGKRISIIGILAGKYEGFKTLPKLIEGAELWERRK